VVEGRSTGRTVYWAGGLLRAVGRVAADVLHDGPHAVSHAVESPPDGAAHPARCAALLGPAERGSVGGAVGELSGGVERGGGAGPHGRAGPSVH